MVMIKTYFSAFVMLWASFIISLSSTSKSPAEQNIESCDIPCQSCDGHVMVMWHHVTMLVWSCDITWLTEVAEEVFGNLEESFVLFLDGQFPLEGKGVGEYRSTEPQHKAHVLLILSWESDERKCIIVRQERELLKIKVGGRKEEGREEGRKKIRGKVVSLHLLVVLVACHSHSNHLRTFLSLYLHRHAQHCRGFII